MVSQSVKTIPCKQVLLFRLSLMSELTCSSVSKQFNQNTHSSCDPVSKKVCRELFVPMFRKQRQSMQKSLQIKSHKLTNLPYHPIPGNSDVANPQIECQLRAGNRLRVCLIHSSSVGRTSIHKSVTCGILFENSQLPSPEMSG